jgi:hypothetical protein
MSQLAIMSKKKLRELKKLLTELLVVLDDDTESPVILRNLDLVNELIEEA